MSKSRTLVWTMALGLVLALPLTARAQETAITGAVTDSSDAVLPGVTVTARHIASGNTFVAVTDASGQYRVGSLRPGVYELKAELSGFATLLWEKIELLLGQRAAISFKMTLASVQESIVVTGEAPLLDVTRSRLGGNIDSRQMQELPVNGRNWMDLAMLAPGSRINAVTEAPVGETSQSRNYQLNIDGQEVTNNLSSSGFGQPRFSRDAIAEFELITNRFDATQGRSTASQVNAISKGGTNSFGGSLSGYFRDDKFNTKDFVVQRVLPYANQQVSGTYGGPLRKDRVHFFGNYEYEREALAFAYTSIYPRFNIPDIQSARQEHKGGGRVDIQGGSGATRLSLRGNEYRLTLPFDPRSTGGATVHPSRGARTERASHQAFATLTQVLSSTLVHELKGGFSRFHFFTEGIVSGTPTISLRGYTLGEPFNYPQGVNYDAGQIRSDLTWRRSRHEMKFGGEYIYNRSCLCPNKVNHDGTLNATGGPVPANIEDLFPVWNDPSTWNIKALSPISLNWTQAVGDRNLDDKKNVAAAYVQDNWTVTPRLTLNLGLRWDLSQNGRAESHFVPPVVPGPRPTEKLNFQPRIGFAYNFADAKTVIRGGFGKYFTEFTDDPNYTMTIAEQIATVLVTNTPVRLDFASNPFNGPRPTFEQAILAPDRSTYGVVSYDNYKSTYSWQSSIGVQRQLAPTMSAQSDYVFSGTRRIANSRQGNVSYNPATGANNPFSNRATRVFPTWGDVPTRVTDGWSNLHSVESALTKRFSQRWQASLTYTLAWLRDGTGVPTGPCWTAGAFVPCPADLTFPADMGGEYGLAVGDQRHRTVFNGIWSAPFGFQFSGLYFYGSGERRASSYGINRRDNGPSTAGRLRANGTIVPRNEKVGDPLHRVDVRVLRQFSLHGRMKVDAIIELFNVFNHTNYGSYTTVELSANYDKPSQNTNVAYQPRMAQLGFRFVF